MTKDNHDVSVSAMIDKHDDESIGLSGRDAEQQFVRLASAYNSLKAECDRLRKALEECEVEITRDEARELQR